MKSIAVIYGSDSSEWEVSVRSGEFTASQIDPSRYDVYEIFARFGEWILRAYRRSGGDREKGLNKNENCSKNRHINSCIPHV